MKLKKRFLQGLFLTVMLAAVQGIQAKVYLVSVGVADYPGKRNDLRISDNDAQTISQLFLATKDVQAVVLTNRNATQANVLNTMRSTFASARPSDTVILYFSGHGSPGAFACYDGELSYQRVVSVLKSCQASNKIIMADACYSGKIRTGKQHSSEYQSENVMFFLSSRTNEKSRETHFKNSLFTIFLERGLRGGADVNKDRHITARELYDFVHQGVIEASGNKQHPVMWGKFDNNMTIIKW